MSKFSPLEVEEIVDFLIGYDEDKVIVCEYTDKDDLSLEKFNIEYDGVCKIIAATIEHIDLGVSPLTSEPFIGITKTTKNHKVWLAKTNILSLFIGSVLQWMQVEDITEDKRRVERDITSGGVKEYTITVLKH